jgi:hypothetical protein
MGFFLPILISKDDRRKRRKAFIMVGDVVREKGVFLLD